MLTKNRTNTASANTKAGAQTSNTSTHASHHVNNNGDEACAPRGDLARVAGRIEMQAAEAERTVLDCLVQHADVLIIQTYIDVQM